MRTPEESLEFLMEFFGKNHDYIAAAFEQADLDYVNVQVLYPRKKLVFEDGVDEALEHSSVVRNIAHGNYSFGVTEIWSRMDEALLRSFFSTILDTYNRVNVWVGRQELMFIEQRLL